jgi:hypothetical protein
MVETAIHPIGKNTITLRWSIELKYIRVGEEGKV